jgi:AcrR family transcriptional regulator
MGIQPKRAPSRGSAGRKASPRGRPTAERAAELNPTIVGAALQVFLENGYEASTMEAIAERARISKGTLYVRYPSKDPLFRAVLEERLEYWSAFAGAGDHLLPPELGPRLRYHARTIRWMLEWPEFVQIMRLIESSTAAFPDLRAFWQQVSREKFVRFLEADMAAAANLPSHLAPDWRFLAQLFLNGLAGWYAAETLVRKVDEAEAAAFADNLIEVIVGVVDRAAAADDTRLKKGKKE